MQSAVRTGTCPQPVFFQYRMDLERNGYKILETKVSDDVELGEIVVFQYQKVHNVIKDKFMPSQDGFV